MAETRKRLRDDDYLALYDGEPFSSPAARTTALEIQGNDTTVLGYYRRTNLEDMINNFIIAYTGEGKVLPKVPRHEVAFFAQRAVQEFSYDIFHAENTIEVELNPETLAVPLQQDFVSLVRVTYTTADGTEFPVYEAQATRAKQAILQDDSYEYNYDSQGELLYAEQDGGTQRWQDPANDFGQRDLARNYYYGSEYDEEYNYYSFYAFQGRRYGTEPQYDNRNGEYVLDLAAGIIYFSSEFDSAARSSDGLLVNITYISDGLSDNGDLTRVYVPKLAEDAVYAQILYNLAAIRPSAAAIAPLYKKEASAKMRNAKHRLTDWKLQELTQVMRGKSKWIKH